MSVEYRRGLGSASIYGIAVVGTLVVVMMVGVRVRVNVCLFDFFPLSE